MSLTVSLIAVLIPLLFMGDIVGRLFREFAVTLSVTILVSAVVSLTLTPMMCARILRHVPEERKAGWRARRSGSSKLIDGYGRTLRWVLRRQTRDAAGVRGDAGATVVLYVIVPKGFFPVQDTGVIIGVSEAPQTRLVRGAWPSASRRWPPRSCRIRPSRACRRSSAWTAST